MSASDPITSPSPRPFEKAVFETLGFTSDQVAKVDMSLGPRSQSVTLKFKLTDDQVEQLERMMARGSADLAACDPNGLAIARAFENWQ